MRESSFFNGETSGFPAGLIGMSSPSTGNEKPFMAVEPSEKVPAGALKDAKLKQLSVE
jgi:hypothetical protein